MARIDYSDPAKHNDRTRELLGKNRNANIFRMMAHSPSHLEQYCRLGGAIRHKGELDPVVRELAITRTGMLCDAPYEVIAHKRIGKNVGVTDEQSAALENWQSATCFNEVQRAALALVRVAASVAARTGTAGQAVALSAQAMPLVMAVAPGLSVAASAKDAHSAAMTGTSVLPLATWSDTTGEASANAVSRRAALAWFPSASRKAR